MRALLSAVLGITTACASATTPSAGGDDTSMGPVDASVDVPPDACPDTDNDSACNLVDKCPGFDDRVDSDADTFADGCDRCPGADDRIDLNTNTTPDCTELMTRTIDVKKVGANHWRGWQSNSATHSSTNDNTITGVSGAGTYNSYFVFSLAGFTATAIDSITLELELERYESGDASESFTVWDVSTATTTLETTGANATIFNDLQTGMSYGTQMAAANQVTQILQVTLNAQARTDLKLRLGGEFAVGLHLDTAPGYIRFSAAEEIRVARLVVKYLP